MNKPAFDEWREVDGYDVRVWATKTEVIIEIADGQEFVNATRAQAEAVWEMLGIALGKSLTAHRCNS